MCRGTVVLSDLLFDTVKDSADSLTPNRANIGKYLGHNINFHIMLIAELFTYESKNVTGQINNENTWILLPIRSQLVQGSPPNQDIF